MIDETENALDQKVMHSISMLKQILEVMPHDIEAMEAIYKAYRNAGDDDNAFAYLKRLVDVSIEDRDTDAFGYIRNELKDYADKNPGAVSFLLERMEVYESLEEGELREETVDLPGEQDLGDEFALVWRLYEEGQLDQEEYLSVLHDLMDVSGREMEVPCSVLHVLNDSGFAQMNRIMNYLSARSGVPCISLSNFEVSGDVIGILPHKYRAHKGAFVFGRLGKDLLVAVLNPFNHRLEEEIETESGQRCHTFLVEPSDYDLALDRIRSKGINGADGGGNAVA
ncbi:MAG: hypothetical protein JXR23_00640 [Pontiellaceae bacterium]|nr:hypothetical protein [Pontiellaceae bacterium]